MQKFMKNLILLCFLTLATVNIASADPRTHIPITGPNFENVIEFNDKFDYDSIEALIDEIQEEIDKGKKVINIGLNSPGGSIFAGNKLLHKIMFWQSRGIMFRGIVREYCMSMCFSTLQHLNERVAYPYAILLDHPASGGSNRAALHELEELLDAQVVRRLKAAGKSESEIRLYKRLVLNEFYMNVKTALGLGLLDKVMIPGTEEAKKKKAKKNVKVQPKPKA